MSMSKLNHSLRRKAIIGVTAAIAPIVAVGIAAPVNALPAAPAVGQEISEAFSPTLQGAQTNFNDALANAQAAVTTVGPNMTANLDEAKAKLNTALANAQDAFTKAFGSLNQQTIGSIDMTQVQQQLKDLAGQAQQSIDGALATIR